MNKKIIYGLVAAITMLFVSSQSLAHRGHHHGRHHGHEYHHGHYHHGYDGFHHGYRHEGWRHRDWYDHPRRGAYINQYRGNAVWIPAHRDQFDQLVPGHWRY